MYYSSLRKWSNYRKPERASASEPFRKQLGLSNAPLAPSGGHMWTRAHPLAKAWRAKDGNSRALGTRKRDKYLNGVCTKRGALNEHSAPPEGAL